MNEYATVETWTAWSPGTVLDRLYAFERPVILKGLIRDWPVMQGEPAAYIAACDNGRPAQTFAQESGEGDYFYGNGPDGLNFQRYPAAIGETLARLRSAATPVYVQSAPVLEHLPRFAAENRLALTGLDAAPRIWIGNRSVTRTHFDLYYNLACLVVGHKRFVLFPPNQTPNLYMGPIERTVSGVPTSMVRLEAPDFERFPRFRDALNHAVVAELEPGDALYVPYMWWHHVESDSDFNVLLNYWWNRADADLGMPMQTLFHALATLAQLPDDQRAAWRSMFEAFVFADGADHISPEQRGVLGRLDTRQRILIRQAVGKNLLA